MAAGGAALWEELGRPGEKEHKDRAILELLEQGDPEAVRLFDKAADAVGRALAPIVTVLDPAVVVIGGSVGVGAHRYVRRTIADTLRDRCPGFAHAARLRQGELRGNTAVQGAALWALGENLATFLRARADARG
jgi:glucokinase